MITRRVQELEYEASPLLGTAHGFSTRLGGVSQGHLASLNLGCHRGDRAECLRENYRRFCAAAGVGGRGLVMANQVHGTAVRPVTEADVKPDLLAETPFEADGLVTDVPGVTLVVFSADCVPILLFDPVRQVAAACHAGWRGTAGAIAAHAVRALEGYGSRPADIRAAIGPAIGPCCFETDGDVPQAMERALGALAGPCIRPDGEKWRVDLKELNRAVLLEAGLEAGHIDVSDACTCCGHERYWSHRYTRGLRGSQAAMIMLEEGR